MPSSPKRSKAFLKLFFIFKNKIFPTHVLSWILWSNGTSCNALHIFVKELLLFKSLAFYWSKMGIFPQFGLHVCPSVNFTWATRVNMECQLKILCLCKPLSEVPAGIHCQYILKSCRWAATAVCRTVPQTETIEIIQAIYLLGLFLIQFTSEID